MVAWCGYMCVVLLRRLRCSVLRVMESRALAVVALVILNALQELLYRIGTSSEYKLDPNVPQPPPLFKAVVKLHIPHAVLLPSIPAIQRAINQIAAAVLSITKRLPVWSCSAVDCLTRPEVLVSPVDSSTSDADTIAHNQALLRTHATKSLFPLFSNRRDILRMVLKIAGALSGLERRCSVVVQKLSTFDFLWQARLSGHGPATSPSSRARARRVDSVALTRRM